MGINIFLKIVYFKSDPVQLSIIAIIANLLIHDYFNSVYFSSMSFILIIYRYFGYLDLYHYCFDF